MQLVKSSIKKVLKVNHDNFVYPLNNLAYAGSKHHGYYIPQNVLTESSVCYCIGAGEDISFDTELVVNFNAKVFIFDPAPEGLNHFNKLNELINKGEKYTIGKIPFTYRISKEQLKRLNYIETGVWDKEMMIKFYKPAFNNYPSHSIEFFKRSNNFIEVPVDRINNLMRKLNHTNIDLLKLEIEGAEYVVLNTLIEDKPDIKMILVEFDEVFHPKDYKYLFRIKKTTEDLLRAGYILAHSTPYFKRLFIRNDIFYKLKSMEN